MVFDSHQKQIRFFCNSDTDQCATQVAAAEQDQMLVCECIVSTGARHWGKAMGQGIGPAPDHCIRLGQAYVNSAKQ